MRRDAGTSFIELMIALAIIGILCAGAALCLTRWSAESDTMQAQVEMERITEELDRYQLVPGRTPPRLLRELPGFQDGEPVDPWGTPYALQLTPGRIVSHGPDRRLDTTDPMRGPLGDDLVRDLPAPPKLPPVERAERPPTASLLRKVPRTNPARPERPPGRGRLRHHIPVESYVCPGSRWSAYGPFYEGNAAIGGLGATHLHAFGSGRGRMVYRTSLPGTPWARAQVTVRLSSEVPMYSDEATEGSDVELFANDISAGTQRTIADNGSGQEHVWELPRMAVDGRRELVLELRVETAGGRHRGLCVYGKAVAPGQRDRSVEVELQEP